MRLILSHRMAKTVLYLRSNPPNFVKENDDDRWMDDKAFHLFGCPSSSSSSSFLARWCCLFNISFFCAGRGSKFGNLNGWTIVWRGVQMYCVCTWVHWWCNSHTSVSQNSKCLCGLIAIFISFFNGTNSISLELVIWNDTLKGIIKSA